MNWELPDVQVGLRKGRGTRDEIANIYWIIEKTREFQKNIYFCFTDYSKPFNYADYNKLWKILNEVHAAAAAKSLQLCPTLCDPIDGSPSGYPVPRIL